MSHASECPNHGPVFEVEDIGCPYCDAIRKAYQHGRRDAANDVANMTPYMLITVIDKQRAFVSKSEAYAEALGCEQE